MAKNTKKIVKKRDIEGEDDFDFELDKNSKKKWKPQNWKSWANEATEELEEEEKLNEPNKN